MAAPVLPTQPTRLGWRPWAGGQESAYFCPIREILFDGDRGGGKSEVALGKFLANCGRGFGPAWRGIIFRREYKHLDDLIVKSKKFFRSLGVKARFLASKDTYKWVWPTGEELLFRVFDKPDDYWNYHGHEYPFIYWDELCSWPDQLCYESMRSCNRCATPGVPRMYLSSANPYGPGHHWVKLYFVDIGPPGTVVTDANGNTRVRIRLLRRQNQALMMNDPEYDGVLRSISNENLRKAWADGDWNINVGGYFDGAWDPEHNVVKPFEIPKHWPRWRAMDWGFARPFSVGWYTMDGDSVIYKYRELYGWNGVPNTGVRKSYAEVAREIRAIERKERNAGIQFKRNPADSDIFAKNGQEVSGAEIFKKRGVRWQKAEKGPGSRKRGAQLMLTMLQERTFKVFDTCAQFIRTVPALMPDPDDWEIPDTEQEDHAFDETKYSLVSRHKPRDPKPGDNKPKPGTFDWLIQVTEKANKTVRNV